MGTVLASSEMGRIRGSIYAPFHNSRARPHLASRIDWARRWRLDSFAPRARGGRLIDRDLRRTPKRGVKSGLTEMSPEGERIQSASRLSGILRPSEACEGDEMNSTKRMMLATIAGLILGVSGLARPHSGNTRAG